MGRKKYFAALAAAGMIGAMALGSAFNSYAADGWTKSNDHWTYIYQGKTYTGWLETSDGKYYMDLSDGHMTTGFKQIDGKWYSADDVVEIAGEAVPNKPTDPEKPEGTEKPEKPEGNGEEIPDSSEK